MQSVLDHILAFWACLDDDVEDYETRNIVKLGKRLERMDMYLYLRKDKKDIVKAYEMLEHRLEKSNLPYNKEALVNVKIMLDNDKLDYAKAISLVESLI